MGAKECAIVGGIILVLFGLLGFFNSPVIGLFATNLWHNLYYIVGGVVLLAGAYTGLGSSMALKIVGIVYAIVAILGFFLVSADGMLLGLFAMNTADQWLHVVVAILVLAGGFLLPNEDMAMAM
jgi:hypothetical protein